MREGPEEIKIPAVSLTTCFGCKHHKKHMVHSGRIPKYAHNCTAVKQDFITGHFEGNLKESSNGYVVTPDWCPVKTLTQTQP